MSLQKGISNLICAGFILTLFYPTTSFAQITFERTYGGALDDWGYSVQQTSDGGYIIAGSTRSYGAGGYDIYFLKTDSFGNTLWAKTYGGSSNDYGSSLQQTSEGGYIIAGRTESFGAGQDDVWILKTDSSGDTLWTRTFGGLDDDQGNSVQQTSDGGYIVAGLTGALGAGQGDVYLIKTDSSGDTLWTKAYGVADYDEGHSVQQTSDGGYIIAGSTGYFLGGQSDVYLIKTNGNGLVGIEDKLDFGLQIADFRLLQNLPNPFHHSTVIRYQIPMTPFMKGGAEGGGFTQGARHAVPVRLAIYDITGRLVETLVDESQEAGVYRVEWTPGLSGGNSRQHASGIYFYRLSVGAIHELPLQPYTETKKMTLLR